jgi:predicted nucleic acid-binding protein
VADRIKVFLDTSALFSAVHSETGGARLILKLGEAGAVELWTGPWVLREAEAVLERKSPSSKPYFALLLDRSHIQVGPEADAAALEAASAVIAYPPDAQILAEALSLNVDYVVSFDDDQSDRKHLVGNPQTASLRLIVGTAGDFLAWLRERIDV